MLIQSDTWHNRGSSESLELHPSSLYEKPTSSKYSMCPNDIGGSYLYAIKYFWLSQNCHFSISTVLRPLYRQIGHQFILRHVKNRTRVLEDVWAPDRPRHFQQLQRYVLSSKLSGFQRVQVSDIQRL